MPQTPDPLRSYLQQRQAAVRGGGTAVAGPSAPDQEEQDPLRSYLQERQARVAPSRPPSPRVTTLRPRTMADARRQGVGQTGTPPQLTPPTPPRAAVDLTRPDPATPPRPPRAERPGMFSRLFQGAGEGIALGTEVVVPSLLGHALEEHGLPGQGMIDRAERAGAEAPDPPKWGEDRAGWIGHTIGQAAPTTVPSIVGSVVGGMVGAPFGPLGVLAGRTLGATLPGFAIGVGDLRQTLIEAGMEDSNFRRVLVRGGAIPYALLDRIFPGRVARELGGSPLTRTVRGVAGGVVRGAAEESVTEGSQALLTEGAAKIGTGKPIDWRAVGAEAVAGGTAGGFFGGSARIIALKQQNGTASPEETAALAAYLQAERDGDAAALAAAEEQLAGFGVELLTEEAAAEEGTRAPSTVREHLEEIRTRWHEGVERRGEGLASYVDTFSRSLAPAGQGPVVVPRIAQEAPRPVEEGTEPATAPVEPVEPQAPVETAPPQAPLPGPPLVQGTEGVELEPAPTPSPPPVPRAEPEGQGDPAAGPVSTNGFRPDPSAYLVDPVRDIDVEPERFQFKEAVNAVTGETGALADVRVWDPARGRNIAVWRDPADNRLKVVNGHQRLGLARRLGVEEVSVFEVQARDDTQARLIGAYINIGEGSGTAFDAAKVFRDAQLTREALNAEGVALGTQVARDGLALANLHEGLFALAVAGKLRLNRAALIGRAGLTHAQQLELHELARKKEAGGRYLTDEVLAELARFVASAPVEQTTQETLFGAETFDESLAIEKAELSSYVTKELARVASTFGFVSRGNRAEALAAAGVGTIDVEQAGELAAEAKQVIEVYRRLSVSMGPVSDALNQAVREIRAGANTNAVRKGLVDEVKKAVGEVLGTGNQRSGEGSSEGTPLQLREQAAPSYGRSAAEVKAQERDPYPARRGRFYSRLERAIARSPQRIMTAEQWLGYLDPAKRDFSATEAEWVDLHAALHASREQDRQAGIDRDKLLGQVQRRGVSLYETVLGGQGSGRQVDLAKQRMIEAEAARAEARMHLERLMEQHGYPRRMIDDVTSYPLDHGRRLTEAPSRDVADAFDRAANSLEQFLGLAWGRIPEAARDSWLARDDYIISARRELAFVFDEAYGRRTPAEEVAREFGLNHAAMEAGRRYYEARDALNRPRPRPPVAIQEAVSEYIARHHAALDAGKYYHDVTSGFRRPAFASYRVPGGTAYREVLVQLSDPATGALGMNFDDWVLSQPHINPEIADFAFSGIDAVPLYLRPQFMQARQGWIEATSRSDYYGPHWKHDPSVAVHLRVDERLRRGENGELERVLFVMEIQSDWSQKGREHGFMQSLPKPGEQFTLGRKQGGLTAEERKEHGLRWRRLPDEQKDLSLDEPAGWMSVGGETVTAESVKTGVRRTFSAEALLGAVPPTPFASTDAWVDLALRQAVDMALAEGYDRIAFTPGTIAAESMSVLHWLPRLEYHDGRRLYGYSSDGELLVDELVPPELLANYVGPEVAKELLSMENSPVQPLTDQQRNDLERDINRRVAEGAPPFDAGTRLDGDPRRAHVAQVVEEHGFTVNRRAALGQDALLVLADGTTVTREHEEAEGSRGWRTTPVYRVRPGTIPTFSVVHREDGIAVGGRGIIAFYDQLLPKAVNRVLRQQLGGAVKAEEVGGIVSPEPDPLGAPLPLTGHDQGATRRWMGLLEDGPVLSIPITPALRAQVEREGIRLMERPTDGYQAGRAEPATVREGPTAPDARDQLAARRAGMPEGLRQDVELLADERAWRTAMTTEGARVRVTASGVEGTVTAPATKPDEATMGMVRVRTPDGERSYQALALEPAGPDQVREGGDLFGEPGPTPEAAPSTQAEVDLFGQPLAAIGPAQGELLEEGRGPQGVSAALGNARAVVSALQGRYERGALATADRRAYEAARSLIRRLEGKGLDEAEVQSRRREEGAGPGDPHTLTLFERTAAEVREQIEMTFGDEATAKAMARKLTQLAGPELVSVSAEKVARSMTERRVANVRAGREAGYAWVSAKGRVVQPTNETLYGLLRAYRHPAAEFFHLLVLAPKRDAEGGVVGAEVLHHRVTSSGLIDQANIYLSDLAEVGAIAKRHDGWVVMAHNHPSGNPTPSNEDRAATKAAKGIINRSGGRLAGHMVINGESATWIGVDESEKTVRLAAEEGALEWVDPSARAVRGPSDVFGYLSGFPVDESRIDVLVLDGRHQVVAWLPKTHAELEAASEWLPETLRETAGVAAVVGTHGRRAYEFALKHLNDTSLPVLDLLDSSRKVSAQEDGVLHVGRYSVSMMEVLPLRERGEEYGAPGDRDPAATGRDGGTADPGRTGSAPELRIKNLPDALARLARGANVGGDVAASSGQTPAGPSPAESAHLVTGAELRPISAVELTRLATELLGHDVLVRRLGQSTRGFFQGVPGVGTRIVVSTELGRDYDQFTRTLAHEVGHLIDWLPDETLARGNILGRLATLRRYLQTTIDAEPSIPSRALTPKDRAAILKNAQASVGPKPSAAGSALDAWKKAVAATYRTMIEDEMDARGLIGRERVHEELVALSAFWRPWDRDSAPSSFIRYRDSSVELYADALSVMLNSPGTLQEWAPTFFEAWVAYAGRKPEVQAAYDAVQDLLGRGEDAIMAARKAELEGDFQRGEEQARAAEDKGEKQGLWSYLEQLFVSRSAPVRRKEESRVGRTEAPFSEQFAFKMAAQEYNHADNVNRLMLLDLNEKVHQPLLAAGIEPDQAGRYLMLRRIAEGDRGGMAEQAKEAIMTLTGERDWASARAVFEEWRVTENPGYDEALAQLAETGLLNPRGYTPAEATRTLGALERELGPEKWAELERLMRQMRSILWRGVQEAVNLGVYNKATFDEKIRPNRETYVPFAVLDYFHGSVAAGIKQQIGTLKGVANPYMSAILKAMSLNRLNELQRVRLALLENLKTDFAADLGPESVVDKYHRERRPERGRANLMYLVDGRLHYRETDEYLVKVLEKSDLGGLQRLSERLSSRTYGFFHPLYVAWSLGWQARNVPRDWKRTFKNLSAAHAGKPTYRQALGAVVDFVQLAAAYAKTAPAAWRQARAKPDAMIRQMLADRSLGRAFHSFEPAEADNTVERLLARYGFREPGKKGWRELFRRIGRPVETVGVFQETWAKAAAYALLGERGITGRERAYIVRNYTGTPDSTERGLASEGVNGLFLYSNVIVSGLRADFEVATHPTTAAGYWLRSMLIDFWPKMMMAAALAGWWGEELKEWMRRIPSYDLEKYLVLPIPPFWSTNARGDRKAVYLRIPHDDANRILAAATWALLVGERPSAPSHALGIISGEFPGLNPGIDLVMKNLQAAGDRNPYDAFRGRLVVPQAEWDAGGWTRAKEMLRYDLQQFGIVSQALGVFTYASPDESEVAPGEVFLRSIPGLSSLVKISDRGLNEQTWWELDWETRERARIRTDLDRDVRRAVTERNRLNRFGDARLTDSEAERRRLLNQWYSRNYLPWTAQAQISRSEGDTAGYREALEQLNTSTDVLRSGP